MTIKHEQRWEMSFYWQRETPVQKWFQNEDVAGWPYLAIFLYMMICFHGDPFWDKKIQLVAKEFEHWKKLAKNSGEDWNNEMISCFAAFFMEGQKAP